MKSGHKYCPLFELWVSDVCESCICTTASLNAIQDKIENNEDINTIQLLLLTNNSSNLFARSLIDTGALHANYMDRKIAMEIARNKNINIIPSDSAVCSVDGSCKHCLGKIDCDVSIVNELNKLKETLSLQFTIIDMKKV